MGGGVTQLSLPAFEGGGGGEGGHVPVQATPKDGRRGVGATVRLRAGEHGTSGHLEAEFRAGALRGGVDEAVRVVGEPVEGDRGGLLRLEGDCAARAALEVDAVRHEGGGSADGWLIARHACGAQVGRG